MTTDDIFANTEGAYLCLIHPDCRNDTFRKEIESVIALAPSVPDELVTTMITGPSWRERLLGLCLAMAKRPALFTEAMVQSLRDPRGISIVPTCAALAVLARRGDFAMAQSFAEMFDRQIFDGEVGWAAEKAMHFAKLRSEDLPGPGPNYGQIFNDHVQVYSSIRSS